LNEFSKAYPDSLNLLQVDNGRFHKAKRLQVPENIILLFQPPHCPELNPIERLWLYLKRDLRWSLFEDLPQPQTKVDQLLSQLTPEFVASVTGFPFILEALSVANIIINWYKLDKLREAATFCRLHCEAVSKSSGSSRLLDNRGK
jgi:hypothetical protein